MKEQAIMKCPHCGAEIPDGKTCSRCGRETQSLKGIEVQYRDFKVTEMLDIKIPPRISPQKEPEKPLPSPQEIPKEDTPVLPPKKSAEKKPVIVLFATVIILFAVVAWFLLLKFIFKF